MSASFGYLLPTFAQASIDDLVELGGQAERLGLDAVWVPDSPLVYGLPDPLVLLSALAATTERITVATGMLLGALRHPVLLAHSLATLDRLARGRLVVGLGSGFTDPATERQFAALGVAFRDRGERLAESIAVLRSLWTGEAITKAGKHFTFDDVTLSPVPHAAPGPPIWLAGSGARAEARVGRLADGWLPYPPTVDSFVDGWRRVRAAAESAGRADPPVPGLYATIAVDPSADNAQQRLRTVVEQWYGYPFDAVSALQAMFAGTQAGVREWLEPYLEAGVRTVVLRVADTQLRRGLETAAAVRALFV